MVLLGTTSWFYLVLIDSPSCFYLVLSVAKLGSTCGSTGYDIGSPWYHMVLFFVLVGTTPWIYLVLLLRIYWYFFIIPGHTNWFYLVFLPTWFYLVLLGPIAS